jgi:hypothetical protein
LVTEGAKAVALGGVGPRHARRPEAADRWSPITPCMVTRDRESAGRAYEAPGRLLTVARGPGERAGRRPRTDGEDPAETAAAERSTWQPVRASAETAAAELSTLATREGERGDT